MINPYAAAAIAAALAAGGMYIGTRRASAARGDGQIIPTRPLLPPRLPPLLESQPPSQADLDGISAKLDALISSLEKSKNATPQYLGVLAKAAVASGLPMTGARLEDAQRYRLDELGGWPYIIKAGDTGSALAQKYTGVASRWRELVGRRADPHGPLKSWRDASGYMQLAPWGVGTRIFFPLDWDSPIVKAKPPSSDWAKT